MPTITVPPPAAVLAALLVSTGPTVAQEPAPAAPVPRPPQLDKLAAKTLEGWKALRYHLEPLGVETLRCAIAVESRGGMTGTWKATGSYTFGDDPKHPYGEVTWEDQEVATAMTRRGWTAETFARDIRDDSILLGLANARVSGRAEPRGTILIVRGGKSSEGQFLLFDKAGRHIGEVVGPMKKRIDYRSYKGRHLRVGESYRMPDTTGTLQVHHGLAKGLVLTTRIDEVVRVRGELVSDLTLRFSKFVINGEPAGAPAALPAPAEPKRQGRAADGEGTATGGKGTATGRKGTATGRKGTASGGKGEVQGGQVGQTR